jgi:hypothetical protein
MGSAGNPVGYTNWGPVEPNGFIPGNLSVEDGLQFYGLGSGHLTKQWNDFPDSGRQSSTGIRYGSLGFIVESNQLFTSLPEPPGDLQVFPPESQACQPPDNDGDGIADNEDECPNSDLSATVVIDGCDSGVPNPLFPTGCTISDLIAACSEGASNHGQFVSCVSHMTNDLKKAGTITGQQKGAIQSCAAQADIP